MKKYFLWLIPAVIFISLTIYLCININSIKKDNRKLYKYFSDNDILDTSNNINLSSLEEQKKELEKEILNKSDNSTITVDKLIEEMDIIEKDNDIKTKEVEDLLKEFDIVNEKLLSLETQYNSLRKKYNNLLWEEKQRKIRESTVKIEGVPTINQYPNYPTGCESVALTILLRYYGINVSPNNIIDKLKKGSIPYEEEGVMYGGNPELEFIGNPYDELSYGVYENPVADVANIYKSGVIVRNNYPFSEVLNLVKNNRPVVVWTSNSLSVPYISKTWIYKPTMEKISWKAHEHAVVLIGYNENEVIISDPIDGKIKYQNRSTFESRYNYFGKKVIYY